MMFTGNPYSLLVSGKKLIGWGSGGVFEYFHSLFPLSLSYLVDNSTEAQMTSKMGLKIFNPMVLLQEDSQQVFLIIYSSFSVEILQQLSSLGSFNSVNASVLFCHDYRFQWHRINHFLDKPLPKRQKLTDSAILIQGQIVPELTSKIVTFYMHYYPNTQIILSTWQGSDEVLVEELEPLVDHLLLNPVPEFPGVQNRNLQIISTREGLLCCQQRGIKRVLKTRSDMFVMASGLLDQCEQLLSHYELFSCRELGLHNRLVIPQSFTRKYLLYSPSDLAMYGVTEDLLKFWSCPLDKRQFNLLDACRTNSLKQLSIQGMPAECYFGVNFCLSLGRPLIGELRDSWIFYRDLFLVTDNSWFELFWPKNPHIPDTFPQKSHRETISSRFWHSLLYDSPPLEGLASVDISNQTWC